MALRVLLADESTTIKKVMQLALQDFAIEVKSVAIGLDVVSVAKSFKPDIVFVDVLLQKRSGYDVVRDAKTMLPGVPVVLMWSGFMELDEAKAAASGADRRLEKPFDAEALRQMVKELVPKTTGHVISDYLTFPPLPDFEEETALANIDESVPAEFVPTPLAAGPAAEPMQRQDVYAIPEVEENAPLYEGPSLGSSPAAMPQDLAAAPNAGDEGWAHQDLSKFKVDLGQDGGGDYVAQVQSDGEFEEVTFAKLTIPAAAPRAQAPRQPPPTPRAQQPSERTATPAQPTPQTTVTAPRASALDEVLAEKILREEARAVLEKIAWQLLPGLAERIVKEELQKILKDTERGI